MKTTPRLLVLVLTLGCANLQASAPENSKADFFISPAGNDRAPGTREKPFATLSRARDAVRGLLAKQANRDITVQIYGGFYRLQEPIVFTLADSAPKGHTVTYSAAPGEKPIFSAGVPVTGWKRETDTLWSAPLPEGMGFIKALYDGDKRLIRARGPGFVPTTRAKAFRNDDQYLLRYPEGMISAWPNLSDAELLIIPAAAWSMNILPIASVDEDKLIARTGTRGTYGLDKTRFAPFATTTWIENRKEFIDEPGEWAVDMKERRIYLHPQDEHPSPNILAPGLIEMIRIEGKIDYDGPQDQPVRGLVLKGLTFTHADRYTKTDDRIGWGLQHDWEMFDQPTAMVRLRGAEDCRVEDCTFTNGAASGLRLDLHGRKNQIEGNTFSHLGGTGILLAGYGPGTKDVNRANSIRLNHIHHIGQDHWHSPAIFVWQSGENQIANNLIHNIGYSGIVVSGRIKFDPKGIAECSRTVRIKEIEQVNGSLMDDKPWKEREPFLHARKNIVERNEIHDVMEVLHDGNGIYISGAGGGNIVRENFIHTCPSRLFSEGIRCDDDQHETTIERNVLWRLGGMATYVTIKGRNHIIGNIFAEPLRPPKRGIISIEFKEQETIAGSRIERNIFYSTKENDKIVYQGLSYYKTTTYLHEAETDRNLYWNTADPAWGQNHLDAEQKQGSEMNSITADPLFVDPVKGDFSLHPDSPAIKLGFEPIDFKRIGLRKGSESSAKIQ